MPIPHASPPTALPAFAARHRKALWRYLRVLGAEPADADDVVHEAFLVALEREGFDDTAPGAVFQFLRTTARRLWLRSQKRTLSERQIEEADEIWDRRCDVEGGNDYVDALHRCLRSLPARSRKLLEATYGDGLGREQAGMRLGIGIDGVKSALQRLRKALHDCITKRLAEDR